MDFRLPLDKPHKTLAFKRNGQWDSPMRKASKLRNLSTPVSAIIERGGNKAASKIKTSSAENGGILSKLKLGLTAFYLYSLSISSS